MSSIQSPDVATSPTPDASRRRTGQSRALGRATVLPDEHELVHRLRSGDQELFAQVVSHYQPVMRRLARRWVRTTSAADEAVQDTWIAALSGLPRFEGRATFRTWLFSILANRARTTAVSDDRMRPLTEVDGRATGASLDAARRTTVAAFETAPIPSVESQAITTELMTLVRASMDRLPSTQRAVLTLRCVEELDAPEVTRRLGLTGGHQRVILHRARAAVRRDVDRRLRATHDGASSGAAPLVAQA